MKHIKSVYIASAFKLENKCKQLQEILEKHGIVTTVKWWNDKRVEEEHLKDLSDKDFYKHAFTKDLFYKDLIGIQNCDLFIIVSDEFVPLTFNGANVEFGMAFAFGKPTFGIGKFDKSVMYYPMKLCDNIPDFISKMEQFVIMFPEYFGD
jgi:nucleoside 2-deoxyribosyltransferase